MSWVGLSSPAAAKLEKHHKKILKILLRQPRMLSSSALYKIAHTTPLSHGRSAHLASLVHSIKLELCPPHLMCFNWFSSLRTRNSLFLPKCNSSTLLRSPLFIAYSVWLTLPREVKDLTSLRLFKIRAAPYLLRHNSSLSTCPLRICVFHCFYLTLSFFTELLLLFILLLLLFPSPYFDLSPWLAITHSLHIGRCFHRVLRCCNR